MNSINLTGRLTADPETRTARETDVGQFRLAVQRRRGKGGEDRGAVYVDVVCFGGLAESVGEYLTKGRQVAVSGRLELDEWEADAGERRSRQGRRRRGRVPGSPPRRGLGTAVWRSSWPPGQLLETLFP